MLLFMAIPTDSANHSFTLGTTPRALNVIVVFKVADIARPEIFHHGISCQGLSPRSARHQQHRSQSLARGSPPRLSRCRCISQQCRCFSATSERHLCVHAFLTSLALFVSPHVEPRLINAARQGGGGSVHLPIQNDARPSSCRCTRNSSTGHSGSTESPPCQFLDIGYAII